MNRTARLSALLLATLACASFTSSADAGSYTVYGGCGSWSPWNTAPANVAVYQVCPGFVARNSGGNFSSPSTAQGGWTFGAPAGTAITSLTLVGLFRGVNGWQAAGYSEGGGSPGGSYIFQNCPGPLCPGGFSTLGVYPIPSAASLWLRMRCGSASCPNQTLDGQISLSNVSVTLTDFVGPSVQITGGSLVDGAWHNGTQTVTADAGDNTGVKALRAYVDGQARSEQPRPSCNYGFAIPCPNGGGTIAVDSSGLSDGAHTLAVMAIDSGDNIATDQRSVYVDNTAPAKPQAESLASGGHWKPENRFDVRWSDPAQNAAPIASAVYRLCPVDRPDSTSCVAGTSSGIGISAIPDLRVPAPGDWTLKLWLADAAGNANPATAVTIPSVRFDPTPPTAAINPVDPNDPTRIDVVATDAISGVVSGEVEVQREGDTTWHTLPTSVTATGLTASLDDSELPDGAYHARARVVDAAGNERTTDAYTDGSAASLSLPLRIKTRLAVGKIKHVLARSSRHGHRRYRRILVGRPHARYGRTILLHGRLTTPGANPVASVGVEVWERVDLAGAAWTRIATVQTSRTGRFTYRALRGPSRLVQFRWGGTATIRPRRSTVDLLIRGSTTLRVNDHRVVNGDYVTFRGHVRGKPMPAQGKLVELQVYTRQRWRTFAQPRANATTGRWSYRYRFDTVRGRERFKFRARVRKEDGYPYELGTSHRVAVVVRGL
jgi:hypothetical protein